MISASHFRGAQIWAMISPVDGFALSRAHMSPGVQTIGGLQDLSIPREELGRVSERDSAILIRLRVTLG